MTGMLAGKSVLVTGASSGIGRAAAHLFAREEARLVLSDADVEGLAETAAAVERYRGEVTTVTADITRPGEVADMVSAALDRFGSLDGAFNNAGITGGQIDQGGRLAADWDEEAFDTILNVNVKGTWLCLREELRVMVRQERGSIVNTASLAGLVGFPTTVGYAASKHAVVGMTKTAALDYAPDIRVNALAPGYVDTPMLEDSMARRGEQIVARIPFGRLGQPEELAEMACWLLSDRASYASGQVYSVDGGYMAG